jgi:hypothetical protein
MVFCFTYVKPYSLALSYEDSNALNSVFFFRILALAKASAKGISDKDIQNEIPDLRPDQRASIINRLLAQVILF